MLRRREKSVHLSCRLVDDITYRAWIDEQGTISTLPDV